MSAGKLLQRVGSDTGNPLAPTVERRTGGLTNVYLFVTAGHIVTCSVIWSGLDDVCLLLSSV